MKIPGKISVVLTIFASAALGMSCAGRIEPPVKYPADLPDYEEVLDSWTEEVKIYEDFETRVIVTATLQSSEMLRAYVAKHCEYYLLDQESCENARQDMLARAERENAVFMAFFTAEQAANDLNTSDSLWKVYLQGPGESRVLPIRIERVREKTGYYEAFYPYVKPWQATYRVIFPRLSDPEDGDGEDISRTLQLIITGPIGQAVIKFKSN